MYVKRFFVEELAHASYLFAADGAAAVVDPKRDVDDYIEAGSTRPASSGRDFQWSPARRFRLRLPRTRRTRRRECCLCRPIRAPARAQDLILRQRVKGYRARDLERRYESVRLLAPFDPVVYDRDRFEAYTPAPKRKLGYYALPLLWRDRVIGWGNLAVKDGTLTSDLSYISGQPPRKQAFKRELSRTGADADFLRG